MKKSNKKKISPLLIAGVVLSAGSAALGYFAAPPEWLLWVALVASLALIVVGGYKTLK